MFKQFFIAIFKTYIRHLAVAVTLVLSGFVHATTLFYENVIQSQGNNDRSGSTASSSENHKHEPLKVADFCSPMTIEWTSEDEDDLPILYGCGIDSDFMIKAGFISDKKGRYIRQDVIVWGGDEQDEDTEDVLGGCIYLKFNTEAAAKEFIKTCDEFGWDSADPDARSNFAAVCSISVQRDKTMVIISYDYT